MVRFEVDGLATCWCFCSGLHVLIGLLLLRSY